MTTDRPRIVVCRGDRSVAPTESPPFAGKWGNLRQERFPSRDLHSMRGRCALPGGSPSHCSRGACRGGPWGRPLGGGPERGRAHLPSPADPSSAAAGLPLRRVEAGFAKAGGPPLRNPVRSAPCSGCSAASPGAWWGGIPEHEILCTSFSRAFRRKNAPPVSGRGGGAGLPRISKDKARLLVVRWDTPECG